jgi:hypothetical protein
MTGRISSAGARSLEAVAMSQKFPSVSPPPSSDKLPFRTQSTSLASALVASDLLQYAHAELNETGSAVAFCFDDPNAEGDELKRRFDAGMFPRVDPKNLFSARGYLMEQMARVREGGHARKS